MTNYSVLPALPSGLSIDATGGQITGTPTAAATQASYTITAQNSGGSTTFALSIAINPPAPTAAIVTVNYGVKQIVLSWAPVSNATYYQVLKNPDGHSGYSQLANNLVSTSYSDTVTTYLTDWINVSYMVVACNITGCTNSAAVNSFDAKQAIGYFKASNTNAGDQFGYTVALNNDGATLAVGAYGEASNAGAVYVFVNSNGTWSQQTILTASNTATGMHFGSSVSLSADGNTLVVGAPYESSNAIGINGDPNNTAATNSGAVYIFTRSGATWTQQTYIKASNTINNSYFGTAVSLSADASTLAVGAYGEPSNAIGVIIIQTITLHRSPVLHMFL